MNKRTPHRGFTLVEVLVVLAILVALSTIAVSSLDNAQDQARYDATQRTLQNIQDAIVGPANQHTADGVPLVTGFVADLGRVPNYLVSSSDPLPAEATPQPGDPLNELLQINAMPAFQLYEANNDPTVLIGAGWQGPYLRLGTGASYLRDGWGNSFHVYTSTGGLITTASTPIAQLSSWGADNTPDAQHRSSTGGDGTVNGDSSGYNADLSIPNAQNLASGGLASAATIYGQVSMNTGTDTGGATSGPDPNPTYNGVGNPVTIWICYYGPDLTSSPNPVVALPIQVSATRTFVLAGGPVTVSGVLYTSTSANNGTNGVYVDPRITIGPRVLRAYVMNAATTTSTLFLTNSSMSPSTTGPVYLVSPQMKTTAIGGNQTVPNLILPHYSP